jgi:capsular exopolysaccharide synthesis family protein
LSSNFIEIIDHAQVPDKPVEPRKMRNLSLGLGAGLFCGLLLALALDSVDDRIQSSESLETLTALPELGTIPFIGSLANSEKKLLGSDKLALAESEFRPLCVEEPNCMGAEAYRSLCSMILISSSKRNLQTIVVTSAVSNEGKSTVSCNLATALAQRGRRVLLVDADMRCSSIHTRFGAGPGLSTLLRDHTEYPVYRPLSQLPNLYVIPAGSRPTDTMELLDSTQLKKFMAAWKAEYDHIIIDTPPILPFSDALTLATEADGVILVARSGVSRTRALLRSREVLLRSGANVLGFVLNAVRRSESYYDYPSSYRKQINGN